MKTKIMILAIAMLMTVVCFGCQRFFSSTEKGGSEISKDMSLPEVRKITENNNIAMHEAQEVMDPGPKKKIFIIHPAKSKDALYILFTRTHENKAGFIVHEIYWYKDWDENSRKPIGLRKEERKSVNTVVCSELQ